MTGLPSAPDATSEGLSHVRKRAALRGSGESLAALALCLSSLALLGAAAIRWASPHGIGVGYDSMFYLTSAESLSTGQGLCWVGGGGELRPLTHYPPLYPGLLAGFAWLGVDVLAAAQWVSSVLMGLNILAGGLVVARVTDSSLAGILAGALLLISPVLLDVHLEAMSEPLFLFLMIAALAALTEHGSRASRGPLLAAGIASALAYLTRYVGLSLIACGLVLVLLWPGRRARERLGEAAVFGAAPLIAAVAWSARNLALTGSISNRVFGFHAITRATLRQAADTVSAWLLPESVDLRVRLVVFSLAMLAGAALAAKVFRSADADTTGRGRRFLIAVVVFSGLYAAGLGTSLLFFDASTRLTDRILSPLHTGLLLGAAVWVAHLPRKWCWAAGLLLLVLGTSYLWGSYDLLAEARAGGRGFNTNTWRSSETIAWVSRLPAGTLVYSNEAFPIQFLTGIPAYWVPERIDSVKGIPRPDYQDQLQEMRNRLRESGSVLVIFTGGHYRVELPPLEELTEGLVRVGETSDGLLFADPANVDRFVRPE